MSVANAVFTLTPSSGFDLLDDTFDRYDASHWDWRHYVPTELRSVWCELTLQERFIVAILCKQTSDNAELY